MLHNAIAKMRCVDQSWFWFADPKGAVGPRAIKPAVDLPEKCVQLAAEIGFEIEAGPFFSLTASGIEIGLIQIIASKCFGK